MGSLFGRRRSAQRVSALAQKNTISAPPTPKSRSATSCPTATGVRLWVIGSTEARFSRRSTRGGSRPQDQLTSATTTPIRRRRREQARKLVESDEVLFIFIRWHTAEFGDPEIHELKEGAQLFVATGATKVEDPKDNPDHGRSRTTERNPDLCEIYPEENLRENRVLSRTTIRQRLLKGLRDGLGPEAASMIVIEEKLRDLRTSIDGHMSS